MSILCASLTSQVVGWWSNVKPKDPMESADMKGTACRFVKKVAKIPRRYTNHKCLALAWLCFCRWFGCQNKMTECHIYNSRPKNKGGQWLFCWLAFRCDLFSPNGFFFFFPVISHLGHWPIPRPFNLHSKWWLGRSIATTSRCAKKRNRRVLWLWCFVEAVGHSGELLTVYCAVLWA